MQTQGDWKHTNKTYLKARDVMDGWLEEREGAGHTHPSQTLSVTPISTPLACVEQGTSQGYGLSQAKGEIGCVLQTPRAAARAAYKPGSCGTHGKSGDSTQNSQSQTMAQSGQDHPALTCPRDPSTTPEAPCPNYTRLQENTRGVSQEEKLQSSQKPTVYPSVGSCPDLKIREDGRRTCQ